MPAVRSGRGLDDPAVDGFAASGDFVLDRVGPVVVSPCSGHGAKFAAFVGEMAADLAMGAVDAEPRFALGRAGTMA